MKLRRSRWGIAAVVVVVLGCGGEDGAATPGSGGSATGVGGTGGTGGTGGQGAMGGAGGGEMSVPQAWVDACEARQQSFCSAQFSCLPYFASYFFGDEASCVATRTTRCVALYRPDGPTAEAFQACTDAVDALTGCDEKLQILVNGAASALWPAACLFTGDLANGEPCEVAAQCASGFCSGYMGDGNLCGTCSEPPGDGEPCPAGACAPGFTCAQGSCTTLGELDDSCGPAAPCRAGLACNAGTCTAPLADGDPCDPTAPACGSGSACNTVTNECEPTKPLAQEGEPCWLDQDGSLGLCEDAWCQINVATNVGLCVPKVGLGESCSPTNNVFGVSSLCEANAICFEGTCQLVGDVLSCE